MITVYKAQNLQEAYLIRGLLLQRGITAQVSGEFLAGGIGELPAGDLLRVRVPAQNATLARDIIAAYEHGAERIADSDLEALAMGEAESSAAPAAHRRHPGWPLFLAMVAMVLLILLLGAR